MQLVQKLTNLVWRFHKEGKYQQAIAVCNDINKKFPDDAKGWLTTSQLAFKIGQIDIAVKATQKALVVEPENTAALRSLTEFYLQLRDRCQAEQTLEKLLRLPAKDAFEASSNGLLCIKLEKHEAAERNFQKAIEFDPKETTHHYNLATVQRSLGNLEAALISINQALKLSPNDHEAIKLRSDVKSVSREQNNIQEIQDKIAQKHNSSFFDIYARYALAKELEDIQDYAASFKVLSEASVLMRKTFEYDLKSDQQIIQKIKQKYSPDYLSQDVPYSETSKPIFIVGLPRTGSTLVDRILSSHDDVRSAGEIDDLPAAIHYALKKNGHISPISKIDLVGESAKILPKEIGEEYQETTKFFSSKTKKFIDKTPSNFLYIGLIAKALPNAKIIHVHRDPMDVCFAIYKTLFSRAYPFSYDFHELAGYYHSYRSLMTYWDKVLPGTIHPISYEKLISDTEEEVRKLLDYCELNWDQKCLSFYENKSAVRTASSSQVREKVYNSSIGKWKKYGSELSGLHNQIVLNKTADSDY